MSSLWSEFPVRRPVAVVMATTAVLVFGLVSYARLPLALFPELTYPTLTIRTSYPGAAPEEVEEAVVRPIEELVATVDGLVRMRSAARADGADVVLEFGWGWSMVNAAQDVRERIDVLQLPEGVQRPLLLRYDPSLDPILRVGLLAEAGSLSLGELRDYADQHLRRELERVPGVASVSVLGGEEREVEVALDSARLTAVGLTAAQVSARLKAENINVAGGDLREGNAQYLVRTLHQLRSLDAIRDVVLLRRDEAYVRLGDVATVALVARRPTHRARFAGREGVELAVFKEADANIVQTARAVRTRLSVDENETGAERPSSRVAAAKAKGKSARARRGKVQASQGVELPGGVRVVVLTDQSRFIEAALSEVRQAAWTGGLLAMLILYLFLRTLRATLITAVAIPVSVVVTFAPLSLAGVSLNIMSLGGLALGIGMLVDNAVVVLESIARCREEGDSLARAAVRGTSEVGGAVAASTLTTVAVFAPMVFVEGVAGQVFGDLALSVVSSLLASLAVALTLMPMLASRDVDAQGVAAGTRHPREAARRLVSGCTQPWRRHRRWWHWLLVLPYLLLRTAALAAFSTVGWLLFTQYWLAVKAGRASLRVLGGMEGRIGILLFSPFDRGYLLLDRTLQATLRQSFFRPWLVLGPTLVLTTLALFALPSLGSSLVPDVNRGLFDIRVSFPVGTPLDQTLRQLEPVERILAARPEVALLSTFAGVSDELWQQSSEGEHTAQVRVQLRPGNKVLAREAQIMDLARSALAQIPEVQVRLERPPLFSFAAPVEVQITGVDIEPLQQATVLVLQTLRSLPTLTDIESSAAAGLPEVHVELRQASLAQLGLDAETVAQTVRDQIHGRDASLYRPARSTGDRFDIVVRGDLGPLPRVRELAGIPVSHVDGVAVPLGAVAELRHGLGPVEVQHLDGIRGVILQAGLAEDVDLARAATSIRDAVAGLALPVGVDVRVAGQDVERAQAMRSLQLALALAVFLVFAVLASQFESVRLPLLILSTVPLGLVGAVLGLAISGTPLSILALIGGITLVGIVVNNAIVLLDRVQREQRAGVALDEALCRAASLRLRPILMTSLTTIVGLLPMALSRGEGAELRAPIAITLISGLLVSTLLTLIVVPVLVRLTSPRSRSMVA